jgi:DNA-binding LacI/PurR family transcriptional regulator
MITSKKLAKKLGVSQSTVSRALNDSPLVPEEKKNYIRQKAAEYCFVLNSQARSLKTKRTGTVGILFPKHYISMNCNLMLAHMYDLIQQELINYGYDIMTIYDYNEPNGLSAFERIIRCRKVDGFIVLRIGGFNSREQELLRVNNIPCVCMLHVMQNADFLNYFTSDSQYSAYAAGKYLGKFKEYSPAFLTLSVKEEAIETNKRIHSFRDGLGEWGRTLPDENIMACDLSIESAYTFVIAHREFFKKQKIAMLTHCDVMAFGVCNALTAIGRKIPEDVQILGMDDVPMASWTHPRLSSMHIPVEEMVPQGCAVLRELIEGNENRSLHKVFKPHLIIRDTTLSE